MNTTKGIPQPWLSVARGVWILLALYNLLPAILRLPAYYLQLVSMNPWPDRGGWNPENFRAAFASSGFDPRVVAWLVIISAAIQMMITVSIGLIVFWRQSRDWMGLLTSFVLVGLGGTVTGVPDYSFLPQVWQIVVNEVGTLFWLLFFIFMILFPNGRFVPRWMRWVALAFVVIIILTEVIDNIPGRTAGWETVVISIIAVLLLFGKYRHYRYYASFKERQQIRWFLFAIMIWFANGILANIYDNLFPLPAQPGAGELVIYVIRVYLGRAASILIPISIGIAIFRYRLWDIDLVIRRTLSYTVLTGLLGLVYYGLVTLMQTIFEGASGQQSPLALVISTLVIAALFNPLRRRIQQIIDRRFFRQRYDAAATLDKFSQNLRSQVNLPAIQQELADVVSETVQPASLSMWIRKAEKR
jgi:hypothetical protein